MGRHRRRDPQRNVVRPQAETLEVRRLLSQGYVGGGMRERLTPLAAEHDRAGAPRWRAIDAEFIRWAAHHPGQAQSGVVALESFEARKLARGGLGAWGKLRLLVQMEGQGDHQFDGLYGRLAARYTRWATGHPAAAALSGVVLRPIATTGTAAASPGAPAATAASPPGGPASATAPIAPVDAIPNGGPPPPIIPADVWGGFAFCCYPGLDGLAAPPQTKTGT